MMRIRLLLLLLTLPTAIGLPARALVIENASANHTRPADDPGWDNVGQVDDSLNAVYLGHGWAATAGHVWLGSGSASFDGSSYPIVPGSAVFIEHDASHDADLKVFRIHPYPRWLPVLPIASSVAFDDEVVMIGKGQTNAGPVGDPPTGYALGSSGVKRWGTNHLGATVSGGPVLSTTVDSGSERTRSIFSQFDAAGSAFEASVAGGDSGGALFVRKGGGWELAGIAWAVLTAVPGVISYGDDSVSADLSHAPYRSQLLEITRPCDDGVDNDGDGWSDAADPECLGAGDLSEQPACSDGLDNDADGLIDTADADCGGSGDLLEAADGDGDAVADSDDNCLASFNPDQYDVNLDGYGNACDADYDDDGTVGIPDFALMSSTYGSAEGEAEFDPAADSNGDGIIGLPDFTFMTSAWGGAPGPSGLDCADAPPCF